MLQSVKHRKDVLVLFLSDASDVLIASEKTELALKLEQASAQILFAATSMCEGACIHHSQWPANPLGVAVNMLQPGSFLGFAPAVAALCEKVSK